MHQAQLREERAHKLVKAEDLRELISADSLLSARPFILEVLFGEQEGECIPGAVSVHPSYLESGLEKHKYYPNYTCPEDGNMLPDQELHSALADLGIQRDTPVLVYGKGEITAMTSCRVLWGLMYAGVKDVRLLDGGFDSWVRIGGQLQQTPDIPVPVPLFSESGACCPEYLATTEQVAAVVDRKSDSKLSALIVDIRRYQEFSGEFDSCYDFFRGSGHIPDSIWAGNWVELIDNEREHHLKDIETVSQQWEAHGLGSELLFAGPQRMIFYCGTGWRSSIAFFLAYLMGHDAMNYDDSFYGWLTAGHEVLLCHEGAKCDTK